MKKICGFHRNDQIKLNLTILTVLKGNKMNFYIVNSNVNILKFWIGAFWINEARVIVIGKKLYPTVKPPVSNLYYYERDIILKYSKLHKNEHI